MSGKLKHLFSEYWRVPDKLHNALYHFMCVAMAVVLTVQLILAGRYALTYAVCAVNVGRFTCVPVIKHVPKRHTMPYYFAYEHAEYKSSQFFYNMFSRVVVIGLLYLLYYHLVVKKQREERRRINHICHNTIGHWKGRVQLVPSQALEPKTPKVQQSSVFPLPPDGGFF